MRFTIYILYLYLWFIFSCKNTKRTIVGKAGLKRYCKNYYLWKPIIGFHIRLVLGGLKGNGIWE